MPSFHVVGAEEIKLWLNANTDILLELVKNTYLSHADNMAINPDSYFLRFPHDAANRIIALPASLEDEHPVAGLKWIASFPKNIADGLDRASAVMIVNDRNTGYPCACLEGSVISAARTAAAAVVGAQHLHTTPGRIGRLAVIGCGLIAYQSMDLLLKSGWTIEHVDLVDTSAKRAQFFAAKCQQTMAIPMALADMETAIKNADMVLFATSAGMPYVMEPGWFEHAPTVLHMSLRDLAPEVILAGQNIVDDVDHCLKAQTSLHLAEQKMGDRRFVAGNAAALIRGQVVPDPQRVRIFSPFGMGVLDLAVARAILQSLAVDKRHIINDFFPTPYVTEG